jgi:hypothetical protein
MSRDGLERWAAEVAQITREGIVIAPPDATG